PQLQHVQKSAESIPQKYTPFQCWRLHPDEDLFPQNDEQQDTINYFRPSYRFHYQSKNDLKFLVLRSEEHTSELQSRFDLVCRLLLEKKKYKMTNASIKIRL